MTTTSSSSALATLQSQWNALHDLDRAKMVNIIKKSGVSIRAIAEFLGFSQSLLRHLLQALQAPPEDRLLARKGKISTNELVRRYKAAEILRTAKRQEALQSQRIRKTALGCTAICAWLAQEGFRGAYGEQIIIEAQRDLANAEQAGKLPPGVAPVGMPVTEIIRRCRPAELKTDALSPIAWFGHWLALWAFYSMPDPAVQYHALELAFEKQF